MWDYFTLYSGATLDATRNLISQQSDIALNWSGGLHHAHKGMGAGFCYINDIVLAIQQLLTVVPRVLYIDIDVHHGDGVEEAFHSTDRVLTLSFHKHGVCRGSKPKVKFNVTKSCFSHLFSAIFRLCGERPHVFMWD